MPASLLELPSNPLPPGGETSMVRTRDEVALRVVHWPARRAGRGSVLILQGRAEFIEKYFETVAELLERGFGVTAFDWRGQGRSDRAVADRHKGHIRHFGDFRLDYEAVRARFPASDRPTIVLAHSMGGCIALTAAVEGWLAADRLVVLSPMVGLSIVRHGGLVRGLARLLSWLGLSDRFVPGGSVGSISLLPYEGNRLSTDRPRYARNAELAAALDWGAIGSPTVGWLRAAYEAMEVLARPGAARAIATPTLVLAAGADPVCSTPAVTLFARALQTGTVVEIPGSRHEILMETDEIRAVFWKAFDAFLSAPEAGSVPDLPSVPADAVE